MYIDKIPAKKRETGYTYRVRFNYTDDLDIRRTFSKSGFTTEEEARQYGEQKFKELTDPDCYVPEEITLRQIYDEWIELNRYRLAPSSLEAYGYLYRHLQKLDHMPVRKISYLRLQKIFNDMDLSKSSKRSVKALLLSLFKYAYKVKYIQESPVPFVEIYGKEKKGVPEVLTPKEIEEICLHIEALSEIRVQAYEMFMWIGYYTGLRISETLALAWEDIDFSKNRIHVWRRLDGRKLTERMKTRTSTATIPLCRPLKEKLLEWKKVNGHALIVCADGEPIPVKTVASALRKASQRAEIPFYPHMLRHSFITHIIRSGVDPKTASMLARHSNAQITLDIYTQMTYDDLRSAMDLAFD